MPHCYKVRQQAMSRYQQLRVNALTGLCLIATGKALSTACASIQMVSMPSRAYASLLPGTAEREDFMNIEGSCVNALTGLCLIATVPLQKSRFYAVSRACFCRYLSEYSDSSSFSCMFTIWTYFMRQIIPLTLI